jgi:RNA polymerase sigma-70 factor, ECF subfamily
MEKDMNKEKQQPLQGRCPASLSGSLHELRGSLDDERLARLAATGDHDAFRALVERYQRKVHAVALGMLRDPDDARDVCQEAFLKAYRGLAAFQGESRFFTWLYRIVVNLCLDHLRSQRQDTVEFDEMRLSEDGEEGGWMSMRQLSFDPAYALANKELRENIQEAFEQLSIAHRTVLTLREVNGLSYAEMAKVLGWEMGTVMSRLFHARKRMQSMLLEAGAVTATDLAA